NGSPYLSGELCGVGWKRLVVAAPDAEPFQTNFFVWYAGQTLGRIVLARMRGHLDLNFSPPVERVRVLGSETSKSLNNITHESLSVPAGQYTVQAKFARFSRERTVEVTRNQTSFVSIAPSIGTLDLKSDPTAAKFELNSTMLPEVS